MYWSQIAKYMCQISKKKNLYYFQQLAGRFDQMPILDDGQQAAQLRNISIFNLQLSIFNHPFYYLANGFVFDGGFICLFL